MTITQAFLTSEISSLWPDNTVGQITPANSRQTLNDIVTAIFQGIPPIGLSTSNTWTALQTFSGGISASSGVATSVSNSDGTLTISPTTGSVAASLNLANANTWTALQTLNGGITGTIPTGLTRAFSFVQTPSGTNAGNVNYNSIILTDAAVITGGNFGNALNITQTINGATVQGGRQALIANTFLNAATSASNTNRNYVGVTGVANSIANDNGTNPAASGTSAGAVFGGNFVGVLSASAATAFLNVSGTEFNVRMVTGSSVWAKSLAQFSSDALDRVQGTVVDSMLWLYNQSGSNPGWNTGILFDGTNQTWPIKSTGTIFQTIGTATVTHGIDFSATTFSSDAFKSPGFVVGGSGNTTITQSFASGANGLTINVTQTQPNSGDTLDAAFSTNYTLSANSATNQLVTRVMHLSLFNSLTGGGNFQNARIFDLVTNTSAGTATTNLDCIYLEAGTSSGTVTNNFGLHIISLQGTNKWGIGDDSGGNWYNATGSLSLGNSTATATFLNMAAASTAKSQIRLAVGGPPTSPADGDIWFESNTNTGLKIRIAGVTKTFTVA